MTNAITCERFADRLPDGLDREIDEAGRAALEAHALSCGECGPLLADLRKLRIDAANLPELEPSRDLWSGISARIATPVIDLPGRAAMADTRVAGALKRRLITGLAAAGLVVATAGITYDVTKRSVSRSQNTTVALTPAATGTAPATRRDSVPTAAPRVAVATPIDSGATMPAMRQVSNPAPEPETAAQATYSREITRLRAVLDRRRTQLDPQTVNVIELNLRVIDDAIAQCRQALRKDPASRFLMQSLDDELENKIELLRRAALLPIRTS
jgi:hypothetical protein